MIGDLPSNRDVSACGQYDISPLAMLLDQVSQQFGMVGKALHVQRDALRDLLLKIGPASQQPQRKKEETQRPLLDQKESCLDQSVRLKKGTIQIDVKSQRPGRIWTSDCFRAGHLYF